MDTDMPKRLFIVIDTKTAQPPDIEQIALEEKWASNLMYCDMEGFVLDAEGDLFLLDECGNYASVPEGRFVAMPNPSSSLQEAMKLLEKCKKKVEFDGAYAGGCSCVLCQEWRELVTEITAFLERMKPL